MSDLEYCLTTRETAERMNAKIDTVRKWLNRRRFPNARKINGAWSIPEGDIDALLEYMKSYNPMGGRPRKTKIVTPRNLASRLGISPDVIHEYQKAGAIPRPITEEWLRENQPGSTHLKP